MKSAIYTGTIFHKRHQPRQHRFSYRTFMMYISLEELDEVLKLSPCWSRVRWALARFKREDFHGDPAVPLDQAVRQTVFQALGETPDGDIRMLANLRYLGYNMNPLVTYYCFNRSDELQAIVAEVTNTPWNERHAYVIPCKPEKQTQTYRFEKNFTVSPFNPINMTYAWQSSLPDEKLTIKIENYSADKCIHTAALALHRKEISSRSLNRILLTYPLQTFKVIVTIYWQALKLFIKKTPFLGKDKTSNTATLEPPRHENHRL